jgi:hypothetical protein
MRYKLGKGVSVSGIQPHLGRYKVEKTRLQAIQRALVRAMLAPDAAVWKQPAIAMVN